MVKNRTNTTFYSDNYISTKLNSIKEKAVCGFKFGNNNILNQNAMIEKNYDPDNDNCPEKDTVENLHKSKTATDIKSHTAEEFTDDSSNRISKEKNDLKNENANDKKR